LSDCDAVSYESAFHYDGSRVYLFIFFVCSMEAITETEIYDAIEAHENQQKSLTH